MSNRVTIQDIADALGLSRNTVSKAINNTGVLADATRQKVLAKAIEMGYKQFTYMDLSAVQDERPLPKNGEIALLTTTFLNGSHFASTMLDRFQYESSELGFSMSIHNISPADLKECTLPSSLHIERIAAIMCIELFDRPYAEMLSSLELPLLMIDAPVITDGKQLSADQLFMDNTAGILSFIKEMKNRNKTRIGFIGESLHCMSFFERYMAYRNGMFYNGLTIREEDCLLKSHKEEGQKNYTEYLYDHLSSMESLPEVLICANDFIAIDLYQALAKMDKKAPDDVWILGFDDSSESRFIEPPLSTVHIHSQSIGFSAVQLLISRIREPDLYARRLYVETDLILRKSTGD